MRRELWGLLAHSEMSKLRRRSHPKQEAIRRPACEIALTFLASSDCKVWAELLRRGIQAKKRTVYREAPAFHEAKAPSRPSPSG